MKQTDKKYWFKRRRYGWGWTPVTWQGWLVILVWLAVVIGGGAAAGINDTPHGEYTPEVGFFLLFAGIATVGLFTVSIAKGPTPKWRWGKRSDDDPDTDI